MLQYKKFSSGSNNMSATSDMLICHRNTSNSKPMTSCYLPLPSLGGASFALKPSTNAFVSVSNTTPTCISDLNLEYLLLSRGYHFGVCINKDKGQRHFKNRWIIKICLQKKDSLWYYYLVTYRNIPQHSFLKTQSVLNMLLH